jgi:hypothetical protein
VPYYTRRLARACFWVVIEVGLPRRPIAIALVGPVAAPIGVEVAAHLERIESTTKRATNDESVRNDQ